MEAALACLPWQHVTEEESAFILEARLDKAAFFRMEAEHAPRRTGVEEGHGRALLAVAGDRHLRPEDHFVDVAHFDGDGSARVAVRVRGRARAAGCPEMLRRTMLAFNITSIAAKEVTWPHPNRLCPQKRLVRATWIQP